MTMLLRVERLSCNGRENGNSCPYKGITPYILPVFYEFVPISDKFMTVNHRKTNVFL